MIVSVTLSGNSESIIGDALRSVNHFVDKCILIDTGITDETIEEAYLACGDALQVVSMDWPNDFAKARNQALSIATSVGADQAIMLDTDERMIFNPSQEDGYADILLAYDQHHTYAKDRIFRLPLKDGTKYIGRTHEACLPGMSTKVVSKVWRFKELPKTSEQFRAKLERDKVLLADEILDNPRDARWHFYMGETLKSLGDYSAAKRSYATCRGLSDWDEEYAWAGYRLAEIYALDGKFEQSIGVCAQTLGEHPGFAEAAWLAGWCSYQQGNYRNAIYYSMMAKSISDASKSPELRRIGFHHLPAYQDGPDSVATHSWLKLKGK